MVYLRVEQGGSRTNIRVVIVLAKNATHICFPKTSNKNDDV